MHGGRCVVFDDWYSQHQDRITHTIYVVILHEFATGLNPVFRGKGWKWSEFGEHCAKWCVIHVRNLFGDGEIPDEVALKRVVKKDAKSIASRAVKDAGLVDDLPVLPVPPLQPGGMQLGGGKCFQCGGALALPQV
jgi:hypothetical protein